MNIVILQLNSHPLVILTANDNGLSYTRFQTRKKTLLHERKFLSTLYRAI